MKGINTPGQALNPEPPKRFSSAKNCEAVSGAGVFYLANSGQPKVVFSEMDHQAAPLPSLI